MPDKLRPAQDESPFGRIERYAPARVNESLTIPRELIDESYPIPAGPVPLEGLREYLLERTTPLPDRDRVWRWVVEQTRAEGGMWYAVAVYLAMPGLRARTRRMTPIPPNGLDDVDETHAAFIRWIMNKIHTVNLDKAIAARLIWQAAYEVGKEHEEQQQVTPATDDTIEYAQNAQHVTGHHGKFPPTPGNPDVVLARLVRKHEKDPDGGRFEDTDAELIGRTYFETGPNGGCRPLVDVATELKMGESAARARRDRAITRMARHLNAQTRYRHRLTDKDAQAPVRAEDLTRADLSYVAEHERRQQRKQQEQEQEQKQEQGQEQEQKQGQEQEQEAS